MTNLPDTITSPLDFKFIITEIRTYAHWSAQTRVRQRVGQAVSPEPPTISAPAMNLIEDWYTTNTISQDSLDGLIACLETFESTAPHITITLGAPPATGLQKTLVAWFRQYLDPNVLVTFRFNTTILGGMVIQSGSHIFDWSFRRQILEARGRFPEILRHV